LQVVHVVLGLSDLGGILGARELLKVVLVLMDFIQLLPQMGLLVDFVEDYRTLGKLLPVPIVLILDGGDLLYYSGRIQLTVYLVHQLSEQLCVRSIILLASHIVYQM